MAGVLAEPQAGTKAILKRKGSQARPPKLGAGVEHGWGAARYPGRTRRYIDKKYGVKPDRRDQKLAVGYPGVLVAAKEEPDDILKEKERHVRPP